MPVPDIRTPTAFAALFAGDIRAGSRRLRDALWTETMLNLLPDCGWNDGGCLILADALTILATDMLCRPMAVVGRHGQSWHRIVHHALIEVTVDGRRWYVDGSGITDARALLHRWEHTEGLERPELLERSQSDVEDLPQDLPLSARIADRLHF